MTLDDLKNYRAIERPSVRGSYRGYDIASMPPPSSGGVHLIQILNILEGFPLRDLGAESRRDLHLMIEAMKPAYADRAEFLGDPAFVKVPVAGLTSKRYAAEQRAAIDPRARAAGATDQARHAGRRTRATTPRIISVVDARRQRGRQHLHAQFQLRPRPGRRRHRHPAQQRARRFRRQGRRAERLRAGRRRRQRAGRRASGRSPRWRRPSCCATAASFLVTGTPGGSRIITTVLQVDHQRDRSRHEHRRSGRGAAHPSPMAARPGRTPSAGFSPDTHPPARSEGPQIVTARDLRLGQFDPGRRPKASPAPPTRASAARWRGILRHCLRPLALPRSTAGLLRTSRRGRATKFSIRRRSARRPTA